MSIESEYQQELAEVLMRKPESVRLKHVMSAIEKAIVMERDAGPSDLDRFMDGEALPEEDQEMLRQVIIVQRENIEELKKLLIKNTGVNEQQKERISKLKAEITKLIVRGKG